ncbi:MAG: hypothetical protein WDW38_004875 [Sanguina aurantia]
MAFRPAVVGVTRVAQTVRPVARSVMPVSSIFFSGLSLGQREDSTLESVDGGMKVTMMRHGNKVKHLGRPADQRKALIRTLVTQLIQHGAIRTTKVKAKVIRKYVDHMITLAKENTLHARRQALGFIFNPTLVKQLFDGVAERYADRQGGYTRIKTEPLLRRGDAAEMAVIELL